MDKEKIKNVERILIKTYDYCDRKSVRECNSFDCILNRKTKRCVMRALRYINFTLRNF